MDHHSRIGPAQVGAAMLLALLLCWGGPPGARGAAPPPRVRLARLVEALGAEGFERRQAAAEALERAGPAAVPALLAGLKSKDLEARQRAMALLKKSEQRSAEFFKKLGVDVQWHRGKVDIVTTYSPGDPSKLKDEHLRELAGLPWLARAFLNGTTVGDAGIAHLERLRGLDYLDLTGTKVTDEGLQHLAGLTNLASLRLDNTAVTGRGMAHLKRLTKLRSLSLSETKVTDAGLKAGVGGIERIKGPCALSLTGTRVSDDGLACLKRIKWELGLDLADTRVTDTGTAHLRAIPHLSGLGLSRTAITDKGLAEIAKIKTLVGISLAETRVTIAGLKTLKGLPALKRVLCPGVKASDKELESLLDILPERVIMEAGNVAGYGRAGKRRTGK